MKPIVEIISKCRTAIQEGDNKMALEFLKSEYSEFPFDIKGLVDVLFGRHHRIQRRMNLGVIHNEEWQIEETRISFSIVSIINELEIETNKSIRNKTNLSIEYLTDKYSGLKILLEEETEENENQQNSKDCLPSVRLSNHTNSKSEFRCP